MLVRFWGTRGSIPIALTASDVKRKIRTALLRARGRDLNSEAEIDAFVDQDLDFATAGTYGGHSSCVEIETGGEEYVLCDLGSGVRAFGSRVLATHGPDRPRVYNVFQSHVHWDHIMGFPFFIPAYIPGNVVRIHACHAVPEVVHEAFLRQQSAPCFPVDFASMGARVEFVQLETERSYSIAGLTVRALKQRHSGDSYGYRFEKDGKVVVYSTDSEHRVEAIGRGYPFLDLFRDADLVVFDAMYSLADAISVKEDWGHSSNIVGVELCHLAGARHLVMFHHEPVFDDEAIQKIHQETIRYEEISREGREPRVTAAYDGLEIRV